MVLLIAKKESKYLENYTICIHYIGNSSINVYENYQVISR